MDKKQPHQQYADAALQKLENAANEVAIVAEVLQFMFNWIDDDKMLVDFCREKLSHFGLHKQAIAANIERLCELANPNLPEDLPF